MPKKVYIGEDKLVGLKRFMTGKSTGHKPFIAEDEPPYEKDEFEIGGEGGNNDFFHVNEGYTTSKLSNIDLSEVGRVDYQFDFDEDEYKEWLEDNELVDSEESKLKYYTEEYLYEVTYYDNQTYHYMDSDQMVAYDDLEELFGEGMAKEILKTCMTDGSGHFDTEDLYSEGDYDVNNPEELNDIAMKILPHGEYFKDCRGFILSNGVVVYTEGEHNDVLRIPGIDSKWQFIELGNIRLLPNSIDIGAEPTREQEQVLREVIGSYDGEEFYLDIFTENGEIGAQYASADYQYIMGEINRFYSEGIKPQGGGFYESNDKKGNLVENTFEEWFGNSILRDEEGNPLKMYHGTGKEFDAFSKDFIGSTGAYEGYGFNFTPDEHRARSYNAKNVIEAYLKVENPMTTKSHKITVNKLIKIIAELDKGTPFTDTVVAAYETPTYNEKFDERYYRRALPVAARAIYQYNQENEYGDAGIYADICLCGQADKFKVIEVFEKLGYDSVIFYDNRGKINTVVVFEPNQIKRTTNKTFNIDSDLMGEGKSIKNKLLINESQASKSISAAKKLVMQRLGYDEQQANEFVMVTLRNDVSSLKDVAAKFTLGVARMFCDMELDDGETIGKLNKTLELVASDAHINEYDRNLNGMSAYDLIDRFEGTRYTMLGADKERLSKMVFQANNNYEIVRIDSFEQSTQYGDYTEWCVTHSERMFNSYTSDGFNQFYFCLKHGFENVQPEIGEGCPLDEYGLSMVAVSVDGDGALNTCTCRWNHTNGGNDGIMNTEQISHLIGMNFYDKFLPNGKWDEFISSAKERLANGENPEDIFDYVDDFNEGVAIVETAEMYNFINTENQLISDKWFKEVHCFNDGFAPVKYRNKWYFIDGNGKPINNSKYDYVETFFNGFAPVKINNRWNFLNSEGKLVWNKPVDQWFDLVRYFNDGLAKVKWENRWNYINTEGKLISNQWYDKIADYFTSGTAPVKLNDKCNFINTKGQLLWNKPIDQWFDEARDFWKFRAAVKMNGKWNFIDLDGKLVWNKPVDQWFDEVNDFINDFARVKSGTKFNLLSKNGKVISNQWYDIVGDMKYGIANVYLRGKGFNFIKDNGDLLFPNRWFDEVDNKLFKDGVYCQYVRIGSKWYKMTYDGGLFGEGKKQNMGNKNIILSEKQLTTIKESLDKEQINEYHNEPRLPFEEPEFARKRYIEQYVDWLEEFGRYGELPDGTLDFWEEIAKAIKTIREGGLHGRFDNSLPAHQTNEEILEHLKTNLMGPNIYIENGKVSIERTVTSYYKPTFFDNVDSTDDNFYKELIRDYNENVGGCWCYKNGGSNAYCSDSEKNYKIVLYGQIRTDDIDFVKTVQLNYNYSNEHEIRVKPYAEIELMGISYDGRFKSFEKHLIVSATYSGNNSKYIGGFGQIDDGFGNITIVDRNRNIIDDTTLSRLLEKYFESDKGAIKKALDGNDDKYNAQLFRDFGYGLYAIYVPILKLNNCNFYDLNNNKILLDEWINSIDTSYIRRNDMIRVTKLNKLVPKYNYFNTNKKQLVSDEWFDDVTGFYYYNDGFPRVKINGKGCNYLNNQGEFVSNEWFEEASEFVHCQAIIKLNGKMYKVKCEGDKLVIVGDYSINENIETEVEASEVKLDSFKKNNTLAPKMWDGFELDSRARLKLLDIADDFWDFANITWVKRKGIHLTGSICNFNWSKFSDIDLHIVVDFSEVDERKDFVQEYFDGKKNEWNSKHSKLKIYGYPVELYVEDVDAETASEGLYDLEKNEWIKKPNPNGIKSIGLDKYEIKDKSAELMTAIDDLNDEFNETDDDAKLRKIGEKAHDLYDKIKKMRKSGLERGGENDTDNITYKVLRRSGYMDTLRTLSSELYDKVNSIDLDETVISLYAKKYVPINEEVVADGSAEHNPYKKRWKYERDALKNYLVNYGELMTSKENGKQYKVLYDQFISGRLGINYCLCIQWNSMTNKPGNIIYVRAFDKFTRRIFRPEFDTRGFDNQAGTADDLVRY